MSTCVETILLTELEKTLDVPLDQIKNLKNFNDHGMDSLGFAEFIFHIEDEFNIRFEPEELELKNLKNFESIKNLVENKIIKAKGDKNASPLSP
jgi:acyl carrier protein